MKKQPPKKAKSGRALDTQLFQLDAFLFQMELAFEACYRGRLGDAERAARKALRIKPGDPAISLLLAEIFLRSSRPHEAFATLRDGIRKHPKNPALHLYLARCALEIGRFQDGQKAALKSRQLLSKDRSLPRDQRTQLVSEARSILAKINKHLSSESAGGISPSSTNAGAEDRAPQASAPPAPQPMQPIQGSLFDNTSPLGRTRAAIAPGGTALTPRRHPMPPASEASSSVAAPGRPSAAAEKAEELLRLKGTASAHLDTSAPALAPPLVPAVPSPGELPVDVRMDNAGMEVLGRLEEWAEDPWSDDLEERELLLEAQRITLLAQYEELLCLPTLVGVERFEYQIETVRKILRQLHGRALLCDEVGLGKTIEAGMVIKEYLLRGLASRVLILTPPGLVRQWRDEMWGKFALDFTVWGEREVASPPASEVLLAIGSIALARLERNLDAFCGKDWDMVVIDEAHHLRRRASRSWALVSALKKRFLLLLSATPVHNNLMELYELVTLVRPGLLDTPGAFRRKFLGGKEGPQTRNLDQLREVLADVMVRNTRSRADVHLPRRFATTFVLEPLPAEASAYGAASEYARLAYPGIDPAGRMWLRHLLGSAGSGAAAVAEIAARRLARDPCGPDGDPEQEMRDGASSLLWPAENADLRRLLEEIVEAGRIAGRSSKTDRLLEMLASSQEQVIVFCRYRATLAGLSERLLAAQIDHVLYHGGLSRSEKDSAIEVFRAGARVLLSTESGGEGRNIHFCRTIVNYDLPWDPMLVEQRIGRVHRIGQRRDVFVFNLVQSGTLEEELLRILEEKIHLFELIVGEVDSILGHLERREEFADIILDLWAGARDETERRARFETFGNDLAAARAHYEKDKALDESLFAEEFET